MRELITESYWLLFDYIKPCLYSSPQIETTNPEFSHSFRVERKITFLQTYESVYGNHELERRFYEYKVMLEFLHRSAWVEVDVINIFRSRKAHVEYEVFLTVLKNMILAGKITKDRCVQMLSKAENYEALAELLQFDTGENGGDRFEI